HEAEGAIERQRPLVECDDPQIKLVKIERLESITGDQAERFLGKPLAMSVALADQDAELGIARKPINVVEIDEADQCTVGLVFDRSTTRVRDWSLSTAPTQSASIASVIGKR